MRRVLLVAFAGCGFQPGVGPGAGNGTVDAPLVIDTSAPADTPSGDTCFGTSAASLFTQCYPPGTLPTTAYTMSQAFHVYDTHTDCPQMVTSHGVQACLVVGTTIAIEGDLVVTGPVPIVFLATGDLEVTASGTIDVTSSTDSDGTDEDATTCNPAGVGGSSQSGGGGGAGGSFGTAGGSGGAGDQNSTTTIGVAVASTAAITLRGGCRGAKGGDGNGGNHGGAGGHSGGAVYLMAGGKITIAGSVIASGAGGSGGDATSGGGGGGTGGLIGFDAPSVVIDSGIPAQPEVVTNGGGGGGGGGGGNTGAPMLIGGSGSGGDGRDGTLVSTPGASGGPGGMSPNGGGGGTGTNWGNVVGGGGAMGATGTGGGGGGGGYGIIWIVGTYTNVNGDISPQMPMLH